MEYTVTYDAETDEYIATAGDYEYATPSAHLAYLWLSQAIQEDGE